MPKFLTREELFRLLQRELPPTVYPDGLPKTYYSTADIDATAQVGASGYANLERIYDNYWPQTADERILDWEETAFGYTLPVGLSLDERRDRTAAKIRSRKGLKIQDMIDSVQAVIGTDKLVDISEWGGSSGGWLIGVSELGITTILNGYPSRTLLNGVDVCARSGAAYGITDAELLQIREEAFTFTVNIYLYTPSEQELADIDRALNQDQPARSRHTVSSGLDPADMLAGPYTGPIGFQQENNGGLILLESGFQLLLE